MKCKILLVGPKLLQKNASYGGGTGGYTRNMSTYLNTFQSKEIELIPSFHTVRTKNNNFLIRLLIEFIIIIRSLIKYRPSGAHVLAQYRTAIYREYMWAMIFKLSRLPYIYDIKAGVFIKWYQSTGGMQKSMARFVIKYANKVFAEGEVYIPFLKQEFSVDAVYWPNFLDSADILGNDVRPLPKDTGLKILFVGYCYEGKGIYELINACNELAAEGLVLELNIIGEESPEYVQWLNTVAINTNLTMHRYGRMANKSVLKAYKENHIFCLPSRHSGEGHNNAINEAMMSHLAIICTRHGFLESILSPDCAIFIDDGLPLKKALKTLSEDNSLRCQLADNAKEKFKENFNSDIVIPRLIQHYEFLAKLR